MSTCCGPTASKESLNIVRDALRGSCHWDQQLCLLMSPPHLLAQLDSQLL